MHTAERRRTRCAPTRSHLCTNFRFAILREVIRLDPIILTVLRAKEWASIKIHAVPPKDLKQSKRKKSKNAIKLKEASSKQTTDNQEAIKSDLSAKRNGRTRAPKPEKDKSLEQWIWDAACSIRGAKDAPKYKEYILPLIFTKRLCDVFDDEVNRIAEEVGGREKAFKLIESDWRKATASKSKPIVRFYLPLKPENPDDPVWTVIRTLSARIGEQLTTHLRAIAKENPRLSGIIDRVDFNATTHGVRDLDDDRLSNLIEAISSKRLGLGDVEPDIIGRSYEYLIRKFAEGSVSSAGEFYTPAEVGMVMARIMDPEPGMEIYDPCCGSAGLLVKCEIVLDEKMSLRSKSRFAPLKLYGQENIAETWAMANMNMIIHDMEGEIELGDTFKNPKFRQANRLQTFDRVVANPMWNQDWWKEADYDADEFDRFPKGAGYPGAEADWGWMQIILASLNEKGRAAVVLDTGAVSRGSGNANTNKEKEVCRWFVEHDLIEGVIYLPENLFYNTTAPGIILVLNRTKPRERQGKVFLLNATNEFTNRKTFADNRMTEKNQIVRPLAPGIALLLYVALLPGTGVVGLPGHTGDDSITPKPSLEEHPSQTS